ncbi:MAG: hypothetical protein ACREMR_01590, partial [Gemmatimonadales bacterium]
MPDLIPGLVAEASRAQHTREFWEAAARLLSSSAGGARVTLRYAGADEVGTVTAGPEAAAGHPLELEWRDPAGGRVDLSLLGARADLPRAALESGVQAAA